MAKMPESKWLQRLKMYFEMDIIAKIAFRKWPKIAQLPLQNDQKRPKSEPKKRGSKN